MVLVRGDAGSSLHLRPADMSARSRSLSPGSREAKDMHFPPSQKAGLRNPRAMLLIAAGAVVGLACSTVAMFFEARVEMQLQVAPVPVAFNMSEHKLEWTPFNETIYKNMFFLKTHKTGSTTIARALRKYCMYVYLVTRSWSGADDLSHVFPGVLEYSRCTDSLLVCPFHSVSG
jgi:hypothetical protein